MPESPIRKLVPFAEKAIKAGKEVIYLNIGQPDIETPDLALSAIRNNKSKVIEYSHSAGFESYRRGLAEYYQSQGLKVGYEDIIVTNGGSEAILFGLMSCFNPEDELIIPEPFYANYNSFCIEAGVVVRPINTNIEDAYALPPVEKFRELITDRTRGIMICNPGNPTGYLYTLEELETLRDIVIENDLFLFADEVYREFCYDGRSHTSILQLDGLEQHAIMIDSVSKRYSMCGARVGAFVSKNKEVMQTAMKFAQARLSPPTLGQLASEAALYTPSQYFIDVKREYTERRDLLVAGLNKIPGVKCPTPGGAFYAMAELPVEDAEDFCKWILEHFEHNGKTVMMAPAQGFYASPGAGTREVRIAYVLEQSKLSQALECLARALQVYPGRIEMEDAVADSGKASN